jgi:hypothetical protein
MTVDTTNSWPEEQFDAKRTKRLASDDAVDCSAYTATLYFKEFMQVDKVIYDLLYSF